MESEQGQAHDPAIEQVLACCHPDLRMDRQCLMGPSCSPQPGTQAVTLAPCLLAPLHFRREGPWPVCAKSAVEPHCLCSSNPHSTSHSLVFIRHLEPSSEPSPELWTEHRGVWCAPSTAELICHGGGLTGTVPRPRGRVRKLGKLTTSTE